MNSTNDPFDDILNLEEQYYRDGYEEGLKDGVEAGRIEGYSLGLRKGFEKFAEAGRLQSKAIVWANRIPKYQHRRQLTQPTQDNNNTSEQGAPSEDVETKEAGSDETSARQLPVIQSNLRLEKNIEMLYGLVEPGTLSTDNDDESVNDFDSRVKGALGKQRIIERVIGEGAKGRNTTTATSSLGRNDNIEDVGKIQSPAGKKSTEI